MGEHLTVACEPTRFDQTGNLRFEKTPRGQAVTLQPGLHFIELLDSELAELLVYSGAIENSPTEGLSRVVASYHQTIKEKLSKKYTIC